MRVPWTARITFTLRKWFCGLKKCKNICCRLVLLREMRRTVPGGTVSAWRPHRVRSQSLPPSFISLLDEEGQGGPSLCLGRAQRSRPKRRQAQGGYWRAGDAPTDPGVPWTPAPAPESAAAAASPSYSGCPEFYSRPPPPSPAGVLPAPEPCVSSHHPATWVPAQGVHVYGPAAPTPAPAPGCPQDPYVPIYRPDPLPLPDCALMFSSQELSSTTSGYQTRDNFEDENDTGPRQFTNL